MWKCQWCSYCWPITLRNWYIYWLTYFIIEIYFKILSTNFKQYAEQFCSYFWIMMTDISKVVQILCAFKSENTSTHLLHYLLLIANICYQKSQNLKSRMTITVNWKPQMKRLFSDKWLSFVSNVFASEK